VLEHLSLIVHGLPSAHDTPLFCATNGHVYEVRVAVWQTLFWQTVLPVVPQLATVPASN
jgi:hypothetical protein